MRHRSGIVGIAVACTAALLAAPASAKQVLYPAAQPTVSMSVPDDWSVTETPLGLELQSPQKDALVLAAAVAPNRRSLDDWSRRALERMRQTGVSFAKTGPAMPAAAVARGDTAADRSTRTAEFTRALPYTFNGQPSVDSPVVAAEKKTLATLGVEANEQDLPTISMTDPRAATTNALRPSGHYAYGGGKLAGQPVDIELVVFPLREKRLLVEQESGPTDARGVMIVRSVKAVPASKQ